jgi:hypothetical protein
VRDLCIVTATWVPGGARVAEGLSVELYRGGDLVVARTHADALLQWADESTCGGVVLVDTVGGGEGLRAFAHARPVEQRRPWIRQTAAGFPPHARCGAPLVPLSMVGRRSRTQVLFCCGCHVEVPVERSVEARAVAAAGGGPDRGGPVAAQPGVQHVLPLDLSASGAPS